MKKNHMLEHIANKKTSLPPRVCLGVVMLALYWVDSKLIVLRMHIYMFRTLDIGT